MTRRMNTTNARGFVLITVLVVIAIVLLGTTSMLFLVQAETTGSHGSIHRANTRSLAASGLQAISNHIDAQRDRILEGQVPEIDEQFVLYETDGRAGVVRILPQHGELLIPEAGKLDLNNIDAAMLEETGMVTANLAQAIVARRDDRGLYQSVAELLNVDGMTIDLLYGRLDQYAPTTHRFAHDASAGNEPLGLADIVTVYAFEPALQRSGDLRINFNVPWSDELSRRIDDRFGEGSSATVKQIVDGGTSFDHESRIFQVLRFFDVEPDQWPDIIDAITTDSNEYLFSRLDLNTASYEALLALPQIGPDEAAAIVETRDSMMGDEAATIAWPCIADIIAREAYDDLAGRITTRCWIYRVRLMAGEVDTDDLEGDLDHPILYEAVLDFSAPVARIAYLRDITQLGVACHLAALNQPDEFEVERSEVASGTAGSTPSSTDTIDHTEPSIPVQPMDAGDTSGNRTPDMPDLLPDATGQEPQENSTPATRRRIGRWCSGG